MTKPKPSIPKPKPTAPLPKKAKAVDRELTQPPRSDVRKAENKREIARLYHQGYTQAQIAQSIGISQSSVFRDLNELRKEWEADAAREYAQHRGEILAAYKALMVKSYEAFERSMTAPKKKKVQIQSSGDVEKRTITQDGDDKEDKQRPGNPAFLMVIERCLKAQSDIFGLNTVKHEVSGKDGNPLPTTQINLSHLSVEELRQIANSNA